ncbi:uncharacterized protein DS421_3g86440 [Arachis hypogaea]|nr:uncharacterized protein DS421_3g86440 [Arachis hypogaea]
MFQCEYNCGDFQNTTRAKSWAGGLGRRIGRTLDTTRIISFSDKLLVVIIQWPLFFVFKLCFCGYYIFTTNIIYYNGNYYYCH